MRDPFNKTARPAWGIFSSAALLLVLAVPEGVGAAQGLAGAPSARGAQSVPSQQTCPDLAPYYQGAFFGLLGLGSETANSSDPSDTPEPPDSGPSEEDWLRLAGILSALQNSCLRSTEYYALLGAAQLSAGATEPASEALERALLIDPTNGAAQIDYAEALFLRGQLFPAMQLNETLVSRGDLPAALREGLEARGAGWQQLTQQQKFQLDVSGGYDNNLNGAPDAGQLTLTLSGEPVVLNLSSDFQSVGGTFSNVKLNSNRIVLTEDGRRGWDNEVRARFSQDTQSDLLQFSSRYSVVKSSRKRSAQWEAGASSLFFGGSPLYSAGHARLRVQTQNRRRCAPVYDVATQYQRFHAQPALDAWEGKATVGLNCVAMSGSNPLNFGFDAGYVYSKALRAKRPGADRDGVQASARFQRRLFGGELLGQVTIARQTDDKPYSPILALGEPRWQRRSQILVSHRTPISLGSKAAVFTVNFFYQDQTSNVELFAMDNSSVEFNLSLPF